MLKSNPLDKVIKPRLSKRLPVFIDQQPLNTFLNEHDFGDDFTGIRNRLIIEILYQTGMRRAELAGLRLSFFDFSAGQIKVLGKRNKERIIPVRPELIEQVRVYILLRNEKFPGIATDLFLLTGKGNPVYPKLIYNVVNSYLSLVTTMDREESPCA